LVKKRVLYEVGGFDENLKKFIDWNLWIRLVKKGYYFKRVPIILTDYTIHKNMKSVINKEGQYNPQTGLFMPTFNARECQIDVGCLNPKKVLKVAVFTLTKDRLEFTRKTFESLNKLAGYDFDHYIVDQGSSDGTKDWLKKYAKAYKAKIIWNDKNMGIPYASNQAIEEIKKGDYDLVCKVDNDVLFKTTGWLKAMIDIYSVIWPIALSPYPEGLIDNAGGVNRFNYGWLAGQFLGFVMHLGGMVTCVPMEVYKHFKWPRMAFMHGGNDVLLSSWLNNNNYQLAYMENHRAEHMEGTRRQLEKYPEYFKQRQQETFTRTADYLRTGELYHGGKFQLKRVYRDQI